MQQHLDPTSIAQRFSATQNNFSSFKFALFDWCRTNIIFILERPKLEINNFAGDEVNIIVKHRDTKAVIEWIRSQQLPGIVERTTSGYTIKLNLYDEAEIKVLTVHLVTNFEIEGIPYLEVNNVFNRMEPFGNFYHLNDIDQLVLLIMKGCIERKENISLHEYKSFIHKTLNEYNTAITEKMIDLFGPNYGLEIIEEIRIDQLNYKKRFLLAYVLHAYKSKGTFCIYSIVKRFLYKLYILSFYPITSLQKL